MKTIVLFAFPLLIYQYSYSQIPYFQDLSSNVIAKNKVAECEEYLVVDSIELLLKSYSYDEFGQLVNIAHFAVDRHVSSEVFKYDEKGNKVSEYTISYNDPLNTHFGSEKYYTYNKRGQIKKEQNISFVPNPSWTEFRYSKNQMKTLKYFKDGNLEAWEKYRFKKNKMKSAITFWNGVTEKVFYHYLDDFKIAEIYQDEVYMGKAYFKYDKHANLISHERVLQNKDTLETYSFEYDSIGRMIEYRLTREGSIKYLVLTTYFSNGLYKSSQTFYRNKNKDNMDEDIRNTVPVFKIFKYKYH